MHDVTIFTPFLVFEIDVVTSFLRNASRTLRATVFFFKRCHAKENPLPETGFCC